MVVEIPIHRPKQAVNHWMIDVVNPIRHHAPFSTQILLSAKASLPLSEVDGLPAPEFLVEHWIIFWGQFWWNSEPKKGGLQHRLFFCQIISQNPRPVEHHFLSRIRSKFVLFLGQFVWSKKVQVRFAKRCSVAKIMIVIPGSFRRVEADAADRPHGALSGPILQFKGICKGIQYTAFIFICIYCIIVYIIHTY